MFDINGRMYSMIDFTFKGSLVEVDGDFTCMPKGKVNEVLQDDEGHLFIPCSEGRHYLSGQIEENYYIGLYPA